MSDPKEFLSSLPELQKGWVWLVGGGPGDPGLITALGLKALLQADFILYDALIDPRLLALARPEAEKIYAGKRAGIKSCKQDEISDMLVKLAREGGRVLRLKGGDPFVFGRGGEEAQALAHAGIFFRIVPGITVRSRSAVGNVLGNFQSPFGGKLGVYEPHHKRPKHPAPKAAAKKVVAKKSAKKKPAKKPAKKTKARKKKR